MKLFKARAGFTISTLAAAALLAGCPPRPKDILVRADVITAPVDLQAYDLDLGTELIGRTSWSSASSIRDRTTWEPRGRSRGS